MMMIMSKSRIALRRRRRRRRLLLSHPATLDYVQPDATARSDRADRRIDEIAPGKVQRTVREFQTDVNEINVLVRDFQVLLLLFLRGGLFRRREEQTLGASGGQDAFAARPTMTALRSNDARPTTFTLEHQRLAEVRRKTGARLERFRPIRFGAPDVYDVTVTGLVNDVIQRGTRIGRRSTALIVIRSLVR